MTLYALDGVAPEVHESAWVAPDANLIGRIVLEEDSSVWFGCTLRGDNEEIRLGAGSNIQENVVCHTDMGYPLVPSWACVRMTHRGAAAPPISCISPTSPTSPGHDERKEPHPWLKSASTTSPRNSAP